jgi:hypothetical protein
MQIRWDEGFDEPQAANRSFERMDVPEGVHEMEIRDVIQHPDKLELRFVHDDKRYGWVFCRLKHGEGWAKKLAKQLADAFDIPAAAWNDMDPAELKGRRLRVDVYHKQTSDRLFVNVSSFLPPLTVQDEPAPKKRQTLAQKAKAIATEAPADDIPF